MVEPRRPPPPRLQVPLLLLLLTLCPATATRYATLGVTALSPPGDDWLWVNSALYGYGSPLSSATGILRAATGDRFGCSPKLTKFWPELPGCAGPNSTAGPNPTANSGHGGGQNPTAAANSTANSGHGGSNPTAGANFTAGANSTANFGHGGGSNPTAGANSTANSGHGGGPSPTGGGGGGGGGGGVMWIALVQRGNCTFNTKVQVAQSLHASALLVVNSQGSTVEVMALGDGVRIPTLMITGERGFFLEGLLGGSGGAVQKGAPPSGAPQRGVLLEVQVTPGESFTPSMRTPVVFVSSAFAVVVVASVAWAAFYYGRRARARLAVARAKRKLECLAKTGISRLDHKTIKPADKEVDAEFDPCAVCIEGYKAGEVVRILPCKHEFHRSCVDPWLLQHRTCPMCKLNILKALGLADEEAEVEVVSGGGGQGGGAGGGAGGGVATDPSGGLVTPVPTSTTNPVAMETDGPPNSPPTPNPACS